MATPSSVPGIGVICCSTRSPRVGDQITNFVLNTLESHPTHTTSASSPTLTLIDLSERRLPLFNESIIPAEVTSPSGYDHEHTRRWSTEISSYDAFVFVTPQYNWGYPASVKNAIDYLYHEWKGKPAMIVSYGGHGGGKAAGQLGQVLDGVRMKPALKMAELGFRGREVLEKAAKGEDLRAGQEGGLWDAEKPVVLEAYEELLKLLSQR